VQLKHLCFSISVAAACVLGGTSTADARPILIDESHGQRWSFYSNDRFDDARAELQNAGHTLANLPGVPGAITPAALAGYEVFFTGTLDDSYTPAEIAVLQGFVAGGGGVLVAHDSGWGSNGATPSVNDFLAPYGMQLAGNSIGAGGLIVSGFESHCLTEGIETLGLDYLREISSITSPALDLTLGPIEILAIFDDGGGWVIVISDDSLWSDPGAGSDYDLYDFDNLTMLLNAFGYTGCLPTAVESTSWGRIKGAYR
jgi:hypothetical protein